MTSGDIADHSLPSGDRAVATVREETLRITGGTHVEPFDRLDARVTQHALGCKPEIELASAQHLAAEARAICAADLVSHLVTAGTDSRPDSCRDLSSESGDARLDDPGEQADPAGVQQSKRGAGPVLSHDRDRQAIGGERQQ